jgi:UDP-glucose:(heptosyl)LPS alpha-1,3-glucosyltransferase
MRLAFVLFSWFPHGGLQQDVIKIAAACRTHAQVTVFCMQWDGPVPDGVIVNVVPVRGLTRTGKRAAFVRHIQQQVRPAFDVVVGFNRMPGLDYYFAADSCFAHKAWAERGWWYRLAPRTRQYLQWEEAVFGKQGNTIALLLSPQQREQYTAFYGTSSARLIDLPPGISRTFMPGADASRIRQRLRNELGVREDALLVLQVGSGFRVKGVDRSLRALASLPPAMAARVHYVQIGKGEAKPWQELARALGVQNVHFLGGRDDVKDFMQAADLLLHPSLQESAGMVLLEAIVSGLPVLTTAGCGYAFHVEQAEAGQVCDYPFQQTTLNRLLREMLESEQALSAWRAAGIRYGQTQQLYDMPEAVASLVCARSPA